MFFNIFANSIIEPGMSGGNKIFIELAKRAPRGFKIRIFTSDVGKSICQENDLKAEYIVWKLPFYQARFNPFVQFLLYLTATFAGIKNAFTHDFYGQILYSSSDYWPDSLPALAAKLKNKKAKWIAGFYLFAPKPWAKDNPYRGFKKMLSFLFWLSQGLIFMATRKWSDMLWVTSEDDKKKIKGPTTIVARGGVDANILGKIKTREKQYEAVFIGRLHPQKGAVELIKIWNNVVKKMPRAKLAIIGDGPLINNLRSMIKRLKLKKNVYLLGFLGGEEKIKVFKSSRIVLHPAIYDSGGMAAAEAMACGLPAVSFDLPALKDYYPQGAIKVKCFNLCAFSTAILKLLQDKNEYKNLQKEAVILGKEWDWDKQAKKLWKQLEEKFL